MRDWDIHLHYAQPSVGFSLSTLEININKTDEDNAVHWAGGQKMRGLLIQHLCDFG